MGGSITVYFKNRVLFVCVLLLLSGYINNGHAQTFNYKTSEASTILSGDDLYAHGITTSRPDTLITWCNDWDMVTRSSNWGDTIKLKSNNSFVKFYVNNYSRITQYQTPIEYTYHLTFLVYGYTNPADTIYGYTMNSDTLTISYNNNDDNAPYQDLNLKKYSNFYKLMVVVTNVFRDSAGMVVPAQLADTTLRNFKVEASILTQHYDKAEYGIGGTTTPPVITATPNPTNNYLDLNWAFSVGTITPVKYELEWTYVDDYGVSLSSGTESPIPASVISYDFSHNNTRVWLDTNDYRIPIIYPTGYVVYRVRGIRPDSTLFKYPIYGDWSLSGGDNGTVSSLSTGYYYISSPYTGDSLNWQYTVSFAEGGKFKNVSSFYDGLLKNRQSITRFNSNLNKLIVTNNIYDYEGRLCIKTLPAPVNATHFGYLHNVDLNSATNLPYQASDFDTGSLNYSIIPPLAINALANVYYSHYNPDTTGAQRFVPDAGGYPLVQTIFQSGYNDRVAAQGGAGPKLQIGDSNYIYNSYVMSAQPTINSLFGPNIGWYKYYTMTVSRDPNQQYSMVVKDYEGRQMVSALIGTGPDSSNHAITSVNVPSPIFIRQDLLAPSPLSQATDTIAGTRTADMDFFNEAQSTDSVQYFYNFIPYEACPGQYVSVQANLSMWLTDQYGGLVGRTDTVLGGNSVSTTLDTLNYVGPTGNFTASIAPYHIQKKLSFYPGDVTAALDSFFNVASCFLTEPYFIKQSVDSAIFPCPASMTPDSDNCSKLRWDMLQQLLPGAAYGQYAMAGDSVIGTDNSIFTTVGCAIDTYSVPRYFVDSALNHCYNPFAVIGVDSMYITGKPWMGVGGGYRCSCTSMSIPDSCLVDTAFNTTVTITALDLNDSASAIYVPFVPASGGMAGHYLLRTNWNLGVISGNITSGSSTVGTISQHHGSLHDTTIIKLQVSVNGNTFSSNLHALSPSSDSFLFNFTGIMSPAHIDSIHHFIDSFFVDSFATNTHSALCHYRYQDSCTVPSLPDTITVNGVLYAHLRTMPTDSFIMVYNGSISQGNYSIAQDLLPLHPQYCELQNCFVDTFKSMVLNLPDWQTAQSLDLFYLDSLIAHDPIKGLMTSSGLFPDPADSLATFQGGHVRLDSLTFIGAYCGCSDTVMLRQCITGMFANEITNHLLINSAVSLYYYSSIVNTYFSNRQRFVDAVFMQGGNTCSHCALARMTFDPNAALNPAPFPVDSSFVLYPDSTNAGWIAGIMNDSAQQINDSVIALYHATDSGLAMGSIDSMMAHLSNCLEGNSTLATAVRDSFVSIYNSGAATSGNFSLHQVYYVLQSNGIAISDLCNPYIFNFNQFGEQTPQNNCMLPAFYTDMGSFMNSSGVTGALNSIGSVSSGFVLDTVTNVAERNIARSLGNIQTVDITADYNSTQGLYSVYVMIPGGGDTVKIFLHSPSCGNFFPTLSGAYTISASCINSSPPLAIGTGLINQYSFIATVASTAGLHPTICSLTGWMDSVQTMVPIVNTGVQCVPCTQMRDLYNQFNDTLLAYGIKGTDHPYYDVMLANFMNYNLQQQYTSNDYETFIQSCSLADSMTMPVYTGYATYKFLATADMDSFIVMLDRIDPDYSFDNSYRDSTVTGDTLTVCVNLNAIPQFELWKYKDSLAHYAGTYSSRAVNMLLSSVQASGEIGFIYSDPAFPFDPRDSNIIADTTTVRFRGPYQKGVWIAGQFVLQTFYDVVANTGTPAYQVSQDVYALTAYMFDHNIAGTVFTPESQSTINGDYFKPEKQAYLQYTYGYQQLPPYQVLDSVQKQYLIARISSYSTYAARYFHSANPSVTANLYLGNGAMNNRYYDTLQKIFTLANSSSPGYVFYTTNNVSIPLSGSRELNAYICGDSSYWYRYFTTGDTLFNAYVKFPPYIPRYLRSSYHVVGSVIPVPHDSLNRSFALNVVRTGTTDTLQIYGLASFVIGRSIEMDNVLLNSGSANTDTFDNCERQTLFSAISNGIVNYNNYMDSVRNKISGDFKRYVVSSVKEKLILGYANNEQFYTLYNYDRAGNLDFTVPPAGNIPIPDTGTLLAQVDDARIANHPSSSPMPVYTKVNRYNYTSLNQVNQQTTINGGKTRYMYDAAGRLIFSQNAKQGPAGAYTYNIFDEQNRITETGEVVMGCPYFDGNLYPTPVVGAPACHHEYYADATNTFVSPDTGLVYYLDQISYDSVVRFIRTMQRDDVVMTVYDTAAQNIGAEVGLDVQQNLRKRVTCVKYFDTLTVADSAYANYTYASHYSYDPEGNVQTLTQDFPTLAIARSQYKRIDYDYDVISGKVNMLSYNRGGPDQFYQQYSYDADNRITMVQTSADGYIWKRDAAYSYYDHGPLARAELGSLRVQGMDYAYTIQGWLKVLNSDTLNNSMDMGGDGLPTGVTSPDAAAYTIDYFKNDYAAISPGRTVQHVSQPLKNLYNGNIVRQTVAIDTFQKLNKQYVYDQLNRITNAAYASVDPVLNTLTGLNDFGNSYTYDADGNLQTLIRYGNNTGSGAKIMDSLHYFYPGGNDKLLDVWDSAANNYTNDIREYHTGMPGRYLYDPIGNTTQDLVSGQDTIQWNLYNKVIRTVNNTDTSSMKFIYDGAGNRVGKMYIKKAATGARSQKDDYYVRDAQGNILAIYHLTESFGIHGALQQQAFSLAEHDIYGSSRLGIKEYYGLQVGGSIDFTTGTYDTMRLFNKPPWYSLEYQDDIRPDSVNLYGNAFKDMYFAQHILGQKQYELTDHLGDVLATVSDKRAGGTFAALGGGSLTAGSLATISTWKAEVISAHDYYPFGEYMPGRYMTDTTSNCVTTTITSITPAIYYDSVTWVSLNTAGSIVSHPVGLLGSVNLTPLLGVLIETTTRNGSGISYSIPYVAANSTHIDVVVSGVIGGAFNFVVKDNVTGAVLGSATHSGLGVATIPITLIPVPHSTSVSISVNGSTLLPDEVGLIYLVLPRDTTISHSIVTTVCNKDFYRYGYNGQMKTNEWAGLGNHSTAEFWEYNTQIGRRLNQDPIMAYSESPYAVFDNNPIAKSDPNGDCTDCPIKGNGFSYSQPDKTKTAEMQDGEVVGTRPPPKSASTAPTPAAPLSSSGMKQSSDYKNIYSGGNVESAQKMHDDMNYIWNGKNGNVFTRWWSTFKRDLNAPENVDGRETAKIIANVAASVPGIGATERALNRSGKAAVRVISYRAFTWRNFRSNLAELTAELPAGAQAHHVFPQAFEDEFTEIGIDINDPQYGAWWEAGEHVRKASEYNKRWRAFLDTKPTQDQVLDFGRKVMSDYNIPVNY